MKLLGLFLGTWVTAVGNMMHDLVSGQFFSPQHSVNSTESKACVEVK